MRLGRRKTALILIITFCMASLMSGCTTFDSFRDTFLSRETEDSMPVLTIGVLEPQTGKNSERGRNEIKGIELANSIYNNVDGYRIVLSKVDTQSKVSAARTAVQGLLEMKPVAIIGSTGNAESLAASEYINGAQIPAITPSATNPLITQNSEYYFRACITESQMGEGLAEYAYRELKSRHIGIINLKNDSSTAALTDGFSDKIKKLAKKRSKAIKYEAEISATEEEMKGALEGIRKTGCDVCFVSLGTEAMNTFFTLAEDMRMTDITYLGTRSFGSPAFVDMMKNHPDIKVVFPYSSVKSGTEHASEAQTEESQRFSIEYAARYGESDVPSDNAALGYDAYLLLINAIHIAKSTDGTAIKEAMKELKELKGVTGVFSFDESGNIVRSVNLSTIKDNQVVTEYVTYEETEAKQLEELEAEQEAEGN